VLLGDADDAAVVQAAAADALAAAEAADTPAAADGGVAAIPPDIAAAAGDLVADSEAGSRGCPLYAKYYDKLYPHSSNRDAVAA